MPELPHPRATPSGASLAPPLKGRGSGGGHQIISGTMDSEAHIRNKLARGNFTAVFLIQCLKAIGASMMRLQVD
ncbi:MAG: DUF6471 domain-containing protein [Janthinobacterium lividum]